MRNIFSFLPVGFAVTLAACSGADAPAAGAPPAPPAFPFGLLAQPCPSLASDDAGALMPAPKVFVEFAAFEGNMIDPSTSGPPGSAVRDFERGMNDPRSTARHAGSLLAASDVVSKIPWDIENTRSGAVDGGEASGWELAITPHLGATGEALRLEIAVEPAASVAPDATARVDRGPRTTLVIRDQQPAILRFDPAITGAGGSHGATLLVTPYIVRREDDLRRLFECKMANRARLQR